MAGDSGYAKCRKCGVRWRSHSFCHCPTCCESFTDVEAFDCHRKGGVCVSPETVEMVQGKNKGQPRLIPGNIKTDPQVTVWRRNDFREHYWVDRSQ